MRAYPASARASLARFFTRRWWRRSTRHAAGGLALALHTPLGYGGYFDCSVVYDEFDSLMNNQFLVAPDRYVATAAMRLTRTQYEGLQRDRFKLHEERAGMGVFVFRTDANLHGKALFQFATVAGPGPPDLLVEQAIVFGRVVDGYAPRWLTPVRVKAGSYVDLDTGQTHHGELDREGSMAPSPGFDFYYAADPDSGDGFIEAVPPAALFFPIESLCHGPRTDKR